MDDGELQILYGAFPMQLSVAGSRLAAWFFLLTRQPPLSLLACPLDKTNPAPTARTARSRALVARPPLGRYAWIDEIPLSRPKRNITRDFSDGVMVAEVIHHFIPKLISMHNYSPAR